MQHLIVGQGEIGKALKTIFKCDAHDIDPLPAKHYDIIHIAIPYSKKFESIVSGYQKRYTPKYTIIHSTVPVGTSKELNALHSPVTGKHPELAESILTFDKFLAGKDSHKLKEEFGNYGIKTICVSNSNDTEAGKLWALNIYGINVALQKSIYKYCQKNKIDFDVVYTQMIDVYNDGYKAMNMPQFQMYKLKNMSGKIGGHCVINNMPHLKNIWSVILRFFNRFVV